MAINIKPSHEGRFHRDVGKSVDQPITEADIQQGLHSEDPAVRRRANFARNARKWHHGSNRERVKQKIKNRR